MQLELYLRETQLLAEHNARLLGEVRQRLLNNQSLSKLEESGMLHALQILIENAIGKGKHILKHLGCTVPVSAYEVFSALMEHDQIELEILPQWQAIVGLRNKIVHDYMNIDIRLVKELVENQQYRMVFDFLIKKI